MQMFTLAIMLANQNVARLQQHGLLNEGQATKNSHYFILFLLKCRMATVLQIKNTKYRTRNGVLGHYLFSLKTIATI